MPEPGERCTHSSLTYDELQEALSQGKIRLYETAQSKLLDREELRDLVMSYSSSHPSRVFPNAFKDLLSVLPCSHDVDAPPWVEIITKHFTSAERASAMACIDDNLKAGKKVHLIYNRKAIRIGIKTPPLTPGALRYARSHRD